MKTLTKRIVCAAAAASVLLACSSCKNSPFAEKGKDGATTPYIYTPGGDTSSSADTGVSEPGSGLAPTDSTASEIVDFPVRQDWQKNFSLQYRYFDRSQSADTVTVRETRTDDAFCAEYLERGDILYYKENGADIDYYLIVKNAENVHSVIPRKSIDDLSSTFMKLSDVSEEMPSYSNVLFMQEENVCGRPCRKYIQRGYQNGESTGTVYVWVDNEYGFAAKGEFYDADETLMISWELTSFRTGGVTDSAIRVDPDLYEFKEQ